MTTTKTKSTHQVGVSLAALVIQIVPTAYVALTGHAPWWIRWWLGAWLVLWLILTVAQAAKSEEPK